MLAALVRDRRRKQDDVAVANQIADEQIGLVVRQVLGDFERLDEVEAPLEVQRSRQVVGAKVLRRDSELVAPHIIPVDRQHVADPRRQPLGRPGAMAGANVEQAVDLDFGQQEAGDGARRTARPGVDVGVEIAGIFVLAHRPLLAVRSDAARARNEGQCKDRA